VADLDVNLVRESLKRIAGISDGAKKRLRDVLRDIEANPSQFPELDDIPIPLPAGVTLRKAKVTGPNYDWRLILIHFSGAREYVRVFAAFSRQTGYDIAWDDIAALLGEEGGDTEDG
jgi:hypothetical protein